MTDFPDLKMKALVQFPARVDGGTGIDVTKSNGTYRFDLDFADFAPPVGSISDAAHQNALLWNSVTEAYTLTPMALLAGSLPPNVNVRDFGAICDGIADDTLAIQAALNTGKTVVLPSAATCKITSALQITVAGTGLIGAGWQSSVLTSSSTTAVMISVSVAVNNITLSGFKLTRSVTATTDADGIYFNGATENANISNLWVEKQFHGLTLRPTSYSTINNIVSQENQSDGIFMLDTASAGALQWYINDALLQKNGGRGMLVDTGNGTLQSTMGTWTGIVTFANTSNGIAVAGTASAPIYDIRLVNSFIGEDGASEVYLDTYGGNHLIGDTFIELCGTRTTGPTLATAASNVGHGIEATANNRDIKYVNVSSDANKQAGFKLAAITQKHNLSACRGSNNTTYGLDAADGTKLIINGCDFNVSNTSGPFLITANGNSVVASGNSPVINPSITAALGADVNLNNTANYFDGPSLTMGAGTWLVTAKLTVQDTAGAAGIFGKLWDGTNIIDSGQVTVAGAGFTNAMVLSGVITCANGAVVKASARDTTATAGKILANNTGNAKDSTITAVRIG